MAQHPDGDDPRQLQSVAVHLITLHATLVDGQPISAASRITARAVASRRATGRFPRLHRPTRWTSTILDVAEGAVPPKVYAADVLSAWQATEGERIEGWTRLTLASLYER
jgi:hypothetical protein